MDKTLQNKSPDYRGLTSDLYSELETHMTRQVDDIPHSTTELYSAISRPGSWEWHSDDGANVHYILGERGYQPIVDPAASWRVIWEKKEDLSFNHQPEELS